MTARTILKAMGLGILAVCLLAAMQSLLHNHDAADCFGFLVGGVVASIFWSILYGLADAYIGEGLDK